ncbi:unnamed protein product [Heterobilharzia americana]|nr:unnamed protein product [Heterobilharzia americana]
MNLKDLVPDERMKIATLLAEKNVKDNAWMYEKPKENPEVFLLGKEVKSVNEIQEIGKDYEESPAQRLARFDMEAKFREDPLTIMKQREAEKRMDLLKNTAKVKKLRRLLTEQKLRKEKQKIKKHSKRKHQRKCSESSESNSDDELLNKFIKIIRHSDDLEGEETESLKSVDKCKETSSGIHEQQPSSSSRNMNDKRSDQNHPTKERTFSKLNKESSSRYDRNNQSNRSNLKAPYTKISDHNKSLLDRSRLSREELEAKRAQMMSDAKEYEKERNNRSTSHYEKKRIEEEKELTSKLSYGPSFIGHLKNRHVDMTTIEEGVHRKASSRQRGDLHDNFLRR